MSGDLAGCRSHGDSEVVVSCAVVGTDVTSSPPLQHPPPPLYSPSQSSTRETEIEGMEHREEHGLSFPTRTCSCGGGRFVLIIHILALIPKNIIYFSHIGSFLVLLFKAFAWIVIKKKQELIYLYLVSCHVREKAS